MSKDVIIAGAIALGCIALIAVAFIAPKSKPAGGETDLAKTETTTSLTDFGGTPGMDHANDPNSFGGAPGGLGTSPMPGTFGGLPGGSSTASSIAPFPTGPAGATTPGSTGLSGGPAFGTTPGSSLGTTPGSTFGNTPGGFGTTPGGFNTTPPPSFSTTLPGPATTATTTAAPTTSEAKTHTVAAGELLGDISMKYYGTAKQWHKIVDANPGTDPKNLKVGQKLVIPALDNKPADTATTAAVTPGAGERTYTIKANDNLYSIAKHELGSAARWKEIEKLNHVSSDDLKVGQVIKLPAASGTSTTPGTSDTATTAPAGAKTHTVGKGETLGDISKQYYGTTRSWKKIVEANPGVSPENLKIGQKLVIPDAGSTTGSGTTSPAPLSTTPVEAAPGEYTVKVGDTLGTISQKELGSKNRWKDIQDANPGLDPKNLRAGQKIKIPGKKQETTTPAQALPPTGAFPPAQPLPGKPATAPGATPFPNDNFNSPYGNNGFGQPAQPFGQPPAAFGQTGPGFGQTGPISDPFATPGASPFTPAPAATPAPGAPDQTFR